MVTQSFGNQGDFMEEIRDQFIVESPKGRKYIRGFYEHSDELIKIFCINPGILVMWDTLMSEFDTNANLMEKVSKENVDRMKIILSEVYQLASDDLRAAIDKHKFELDYFPNTISFLLFSFYFF
jgi:hypothetical protein